MLAPGCATLPWGMRRSTLRPPRLQTCDEPSMSLHKEPVQSVAHRHMPHVAILILRHSHEGRSQSILKAREAIGRKAAVLVPDLVLDLGDKLVLLVLSGHGLPRRSRCPLAPAEVVRVGDVHSKRGDNAE